MTVKWGDFIVVEMRAGEGGVQLIVTVKWEDFIAEQAKEWPLVALDKVQLALETGLEELAVTVKP